MNKYDTEYLSGAYVLMRIVDIPNIYIKVWTQKNEFPQRKNIRYLMQASIIRQRKFELSDIEYDQIKDEIKIWNM